MRKLILFATLNLIVSISFAQESLLSIGYGKTFVTNDSSTLNITFDINRIPGATEKAGGYYFINRNLRQGSNWRYYFAPMVDINIGSAVSSAPNNISAGLPIGIAFDPDAGNSTLYFEVSPTMVSDRTFSNQLYFGSQNIYYRFERFTSSTVDPVLPKPVINATVGISNAVGSRYLTADKQNEFYGRIAVPVLAKISFFADTVNKSAAFYRFKLSAGFKFNHVYADNRIANPKKNYTFFTSRIDFFINPKVGFNVIYNNGNEEPVFKLNNSLTFGFSLSR